MDPERWERAFIERQRVARLATVDERGRPHVVPIVFAYDGQRLFTPIDAKPKRVSASRLKRVQNVQSDPHVVVLFDHYDEDWRRLAWVQLHGLATFIDSGSERETGAGLLAQRYPQYREGSLAGRPVILITEERITSWRAAD